MKDPQVDALIDKATSATDLAATQQAWTDVDKKVMDGAYVVPTVWAKGLYYRPPTMTNVYFNPAFGMYDYVSLGVKK